MTNPVARPEVERLRERIETFDISPVFDAKGSYSTRKSAEWAALRDEILAYLRAVEGERDLAHSIIKGVHGALADARTVPVPAHHQDLYESVMQIVRERDAAEAQLAALTPTPETVERVARAIYDAHPKQTVGRVTSPSWEENSKTDTYYRRMARAALAALRGDG